MQDDASIALAKDIVHLLREHTNSPADRRLVLTSLSMARDLYLLSAPTYLDEQETEKSPAAMR
jgi:hypothetical protein